MIKGERMNDLSDIVSSVEKQYKQIPIRRDGKLIRRNEKCPCESGLKFKKCCLLKRKTNEE